MGFEVIKGRRRTRAGWCSGLESHIRRSYGTVCVVKAFKKELERAIRFRKRTRRRIEVNSRKGKSLLVQFLYSEQELGAWVLVRRY